MIPLELLKQALDEQRLIFHIQPIVTPAAAARPRLRHGAAADAGGWRTGRGPRFHAAPRGEAVVRRIERLAIEEAITLARRARSSGQPVTLGIPMTPRHAGRCAGHRQDRGAAGGQPRHRRRPGAGGRRSRLERHAAEREGGARRFRRQGGGAVARRRPLAPPQLLRARLGRRPLGPLRCRPLPRHAAGFHRLP